MLKPNVIHIGEDGVCMDTAGGGALSILSLNIRSLVNKLSLFELFVDSLEKESQSIDIIFLSDTFLQEENIQFYNINGYKAYHFTRTGRRGGGITFFIREAIKVDHKIKKILVVKYNF